MRFVVLIGGASGFAVAGLTGVVAGHTADRTLLDAALGCLAGGLLFRAFWMILLRGIREAFLARRAAPVEPPTPKPLP